MKLFSSAYGLTVMLRLTWNWAFILWNDYDLCLLCFCLMPQRALYVFALLCAYLRILTRLEIHLLGLCLLLVSVIAELSFWSQSSKQLGTGWSELGGQTLKLPLFHLTLLIVMAF